MINSLLDLPVTGAYLKRIGAEEIHFHLAHIKEMVLGYPKVTGRVKFFEDGNTKCWGKAEAPTEAEAAGIRAEFASAEFPKIVSIAAITDPPPKCDLNDPKTFVCHDFRGNIVMVHQRYENTDGTKGFLPWTRWSDRKWRVMEPDVMPFYGLPGADQFNTLFLHEGSKAAARVKRMISGEEATGNFPWLEEMRWGAHVGWIGGVHALDRSDWQSLAAMSWKRVIIVADHDDGGRDVVPKIAKQFHCPTFVLAFTDSWPDTFDLGDDWPPELFGDEGQYIGPTFNQCIQPASWATDEVTVIGDNGKPKIVHMIRPSFARQWVWVSNQDLMVNIEMTNYKMAAQKFNAFVRPFSHIKDTLGLFHKRYSGNQMELTYDPSVDGTIVRVSSGVQAINLFQPGPIQPLAGDWSPWTRFLEHMFPTPEDRRLVARWAATLIARPKTRMIFGLLLMSEAQGVGKGTFARVLAELVGEANTSFPSASLIVEGQFNGWIAEKRLICVDEIYEGHSWKAYNKLKPYVTDKQIEVNVKHLATWTMPNWTHYILMSNSRAALRVENSDRRWLVPQVTEAIWSEAEFSAFYDWVRGGGLATVAMWAKTFEERKEGRFVRAGETAPSTATKVRLVDESRSEAEVLLDDLGEAVAELAAPVALSMTAIREWVTSQVNDKVFETPQQMGRVLRKHGLIALDKERWAGGGGADRVKIGGAKHTVLVNQPEMLDLEAAAIRAAIKAPGEIISEPL